MDRIKRHVQLDQSDCTLISNSERALDHALHQLTKDRSVLQNFIASHPEWEKSLKPLSVAQNEPQVTSSVINSSVINSSVINSSAMASMERASNPYSVGPMASVAGVLADRMKAVMISNPDVKIAVVENGGEISLRSEEPITIGLLVLSTSLQASLGFRYPGKNRDMGVATSSATFGHAESLGEADAVVVFAENAGVADAAATAICNHVRGNTPQKAIEKGIEAYYTFPKLKGVFIVNKGLTGTAGTLPQIVHIQDPEGKIARSYQKK